MGAIVIPILWKRKEKVWEVKQLSNIIWVEVTEMNSGPLDGHHLESCFPKTSPKIGWMYENRLGTYPRTTDPATLSQ